VTLRGLDYSNGRPRASAVKAAGFAAVLRYLSHTPYKNLTLAEAGDMIANGVDVVAVWETVADRALAGATAGSDDGKAAKRQYETCGAPAEAAIFYAVDFDAQPSQFAAIQRYQDAFFAAIAPHPGGVYGSYAVVEHFVGTGATYAWQTVAWSHGKRSPKAHIFQMTGYVTVDGVTCDRNELTAPYGGWAGVAPPPPAPPAPVHMTIQGVPMGRITITIPTDAVGDGDAFISAADKFGAISGAGVHDKYDPATHDPDSIVVPIGARDDGDHFTAVIAHGPPNAQVTTWALVAD